MADAWLKPTDIDGMATAGETPVTVAHYLGLTPKWVDGTAVGGCSFMIHVRHAAAAIESGLCKTVLITHGESGRSGVECTRSWLTQEPALDLGRTRNPMRPGASNHEAFELKFTGGGWPFDPASRESKNKPISSPL
jgi:acetyl-CoA acetyltransferase